MIEWRQPVGLVNRGLPFERELIERSAIGYLNVADIVNNPVGQGLVWISGHGLGKAFFDFFGLGDPATNEPRDNGRLPRSPGARGDALPDELPGDPAHAEPGGPERADPGDRGLF